MRDCVKAKQQAWTITLQLPGQLRPWHNENYQRGSEGMETVMKERGGIAIDKSLCQREQLNHVEIMSVYLKMIGSKQKERTVGGGEIS